MKVKHCTYGKGEIIWQDPLKPYLVAVEFKNGEVIEVHGRDLKSAEFPHMAVATGILIAAATLIWLTYVA